MAGHAATTGWTVRRAALCGIAGPLVFTLAWVVLGALEPGYDPAAQFISELAAYGARRAAVMVTAFLALGLLSLAFAPGLQRGIAAGAGGAIGPALVGVFGLCTLGSGLVRCDPGCDGASFNNSTHSLITHIGLGALILATLVLPLRVAGAARWRGFRAYSWLTGGAVIAIVLVGFDRFGGPGLGQRLFVELLLLWLAVSAAYLLLPTRSRAALSTT